MSHIAINLNFYPARCGWLMALIECCLQVIGVGSTFQLCIKAKRLNGRQGVSGLLHTPLPPRPAQFYCPLWFLNRVAFYLRRRAGQSPLQYSLYTVVVKYIKCFASSFSQFQTIKKSLRNIAKVFLSWNSFAERYGRWTRRAWHIAAVVSDLEQVAITWS